MIWQKIQEEIEAVPGNGPALGALCDLLETGEAIVPWWGPGLRQGCGRCGMNFCKDLSSIPGNTVN